MDFIRWERPIEEPVTIAVIGSKRLYQQLQVVAAAKKAKGREFRIIEISETDSTEGIEVLYVGLGYKSNWQTIFEDARANSVLTVGEEDQFLEAGGLIQFSIQRNRLRFALNLDEAENYQLSLSSKLVQLAVR